MQTVVATLFSLLCPWLALVRVMQFAAGGAIRLRPAVRLIIIGVAAVGVLAVPVGGFTIASWIRSVAVNFSLPLTALLGASVWEKAFGRALLTPTDQLTGWTFGFLGGLIFYPFALGWGNFDPYEWGWGFSPLFIGSTLVSAALLWKRNRFGGVLVMAVAAYHLHLLESENYWDYLLDPIYFLIAMGVLVTRVFARRHRNQTPAESRE